MTATMQKTMSETDSRKLLTVIQDLSPNQSDAFTSWVNKGARADDVERVARNIDSQFQYKPVYTDVRKKLVSQYERSATELLTEALRDYASKRP